VAGQDPRAPKRGEELLQELHGHLAALGDLADGHRRVAHARELGQSDHRVT
jgi:hypothetical protein